MYLSKKRMRYFLWISIVTFLCLKLESVQFLTPFGKVYREIPIVLAAVLMLFYVLRFRKFSKISSYFLIYCVYLIIMTVINRGSVHTALIQICPSVCMVLICDINMRDKPINFLEVIGTFLSVLVVFDFLSILLFPNGLFKTSLYTDNWILGYKTQRVNIAIPAIAALATSSILRKGKVSLVTWVILVIGIMSALFSGAIGGLVAMILFALFLFLVYGIGNSINVQIIVSKFLNAKVIFAILIVLNILIAVLQNIELFEFLIIGVLDKSETLTGRTIIWERCLEIIREHPFFGVGYLNSNEFVDLTGILGGTQPHNMILGFLVYSGVVGLGLYAIPLFKSISCTKPSNYRVSSAYVFCIIINMVIGITSLNNFTTFNFASIVILWYVNTLQRDDRIDL